MTEAQTPEARAAEDAAVLARFFHERLLPLAPADADFVHGLGDVTLKNWNGIEVGRLAAEPSLRG